MTTFLLPLLLSAVLSGCQQGARPAGPSESNASASFTVVLEESDAGSLGRPLEAAIRDYQAAHPEVQITVEQLINSYPSPGITEQELATLAERRAAQTSRLRAEVMSGGGPDLFLLHTSYIWADNLLPDVNKAVRAGTFADLTPLLERDETFRPQDFYAPLLDAGKVDGRQYVLPLSFTMPMFLSTQKGLDSVGFDLIAAQTGMDAFLSEAARCLPEEQWNSMTLIEYAAALKQPLLDYDTHRVAFDTPAVRMAFSYQYAFSNPAWQPDPAVNYVPTMSLSPAQEGDADRVQKLASGKLKLFGCPLFLGGSIPAHAERLQALGVLPVFLPLPNEEGGVTATVDSYAAIRAGSPNAEAAYGLIQYLLDDARQEQKAYPGVYLPAKKAALRGAVENAEAAYEEAGVPMMNDEIFTAFASAVGKMDTAHLQSALSYGALNYGDDLSGLLMDLENRYLSGALTLDEFIERAEDTLQLYLEE